MESLDKIKRNKDQGNLLTLYIKSFIHAFDGLKYYLRNEHNMVIIIIAIIVVVTLGFYFSINTYEWLFCLTMIGCVTSCELINTSIEATIDLCSPNMHPLAKLAKDSASAAVLCLSIVSVIGAAIIFIPKI